MYLDETPIKEDLKKEQLKLVDLQQVFDFVLKKYYERSEGYFPTYTVVLKGTDCPKSSF